MGSDLDGDKYCLRWNDFTSNISSAFKELRDDEDFFDITLLTEEGEIRAHKLILGACSPHFRQIIKRLPNIQNPAIYLRGVRHEDIKNILEFMYLGEVNVGQDELDSFLAVAEDLCIKGLTQTASTPASGGQNQNQHQQRHSSPPSPAPAKPGPPAAKKLKMSKNGGAGDSARAKKSATTTPEPPLPASAAVKSELLTTEVQMDPENFEASYDDYYDGAGPSESGGEEGSKAADEQEDLAYEINEYVTSMSGKTGEGRYQCLICGMTCRDLYNQREHLMTHMTRDEKFRNRMDSFMRANVFKHPETLVTTCLICDATVGASLKKHFLTKHLREPKPMQLPDDGI